MNIYQRINEVRKAVSFIQKDKKVETYMAVTHDAVTAATRELFIAQGILIIPSILASRVEMTGTQTSRGTPFIRYEARYRFDVVNIDEPQDRFPMEIESHAIDHGDKAPGKALSYAKKALVLKLLEIETGEEEEGRAEQFKPKKPLSVGGEAFTALEPDWQTALLDIFDGVRNELNEKGPLAAIELLESESSDLDADKKVALWSRFDSKERSAMKKAKAEKKAA